MIPTFVIALREGVEASLIVGIIAAFLVKEGRQDAMRQMWIGVGDRGRPLRRRSPSSSTGRPAAAPARAGGAGDGDRPDRGLRRDLHDRLDAPPRARHQGGAGGRGRHARWPAGSTMALVAMAFLAVLREGFETSVFLLAAFQDASDTTAAGAGAVLGLLAAVAIGLGLYRGGVRINLTRFFRITGLDPRLRRRRPARHRRPHRPRGGLDQRPPGPGARPHLAGPAGHDLRLAADRDAGPAAAADRDRGRRLPAYAVPMALYVALARPPAPRRRGAAPAAASSAAPAESPA